MDYIKIAQANIAEQYPLVSYQYPKIHDLPTGAIIGTWAYSVPGKVRFILEPEREIACGVLPADVTRAWIKDVYNLPLRRRKTQFNTHYTLPLKAVKGEYDHCSYVDIRGAYLSIIRLGFDLEYVRGKYLACNPVAVPHEIAVNKMCYSIGVSMSNTKLSHITIMGKNGLFENKKFNMYSNPCLYALACDSLAAIAAEVQVTMGEHVCYANTDGFIVNTRYVQQLQNIISSWGLASRVKYAGKTQIFGVGSFRCGSFKTERMNAHAPNFMSVLPLDDERKWIKERFVKFQQNYDILLT